MAAISRISNPSDYVKISDAIGPGGPLHWMNDHQLRWVARNRKDNGYAAAFCSSAGRSLLVHIPTFMQITDGHRLQGAQE